VNVKAEKVIVTLVVLSFALTVINMLVFQGFSLTKEEAIEISRSTRLVQDWLAEADRYGLEVFYLNSTQVNKAREEFPGLREMYPENRSIWVVTWYIHPKDAVSSFAYVAGHVIDEETGQIFYEGSASAR